MHSLNLIWEFTPPPLSVSPLVWTSVSISLEVQFKRLAENILVITYMGSALIVLREIVVTLEEVESILNSQVPTNLLEAVPRQCDNGQVTHVVVNEILYYCQIILQ